LTYVTGGARGIKLYYRPALFGQGAIVVALDDDAAAAPFPRPAETANAKTFVKGTTYNSGDAVINKGIVAKLVSARLEAGTLSAAFLIYNGGQKDVSISSMVSFEAKDSEGAKGKFKFATQGTQLDGTLVPGDTLKGTLSWEFSPKASDLKIYYTDNLFLGDTIVWSAQ
jgi:hypothetical protein